MANASETSMKRSVTSWRALMRASSRAEPENTIPQVTMHRTADPYATLDWRRADSGARAAGAARSVATSWRSAGDTGKPE